MRRQKRLIKLISFTLVLGVLFAHWSGWNLRAAEATLIESTSSYSNARLRGTYAGVTHGMQGLGSSQGSSVFAGMPVVTFDGAGNLFGRQTASVNGLIVKETFQGFYSVNADGSGFLVIHVAGLPGALHVDFVIVDNGNEIASIGTDPGTALVGVLKKQ